MRPSTVLFDSLIRHISSGNYQESINTFSKASPGREDYDKSLLLIINILLEGKGKTSSINLKKWYKLLNTLASNDNVLAIYTQSIKAELENDLTSALQLLEKCIEIDKKFSSAKSKKSSILLKQAKWAEAETVLRELIKEQKNETYLLNNLSIALLRQNKLDEALKYALKAIENAKNTQQASTYVNVGTILQEKGRLKEAELHYKRALHIEEGHINAILNLGVIQLEKKNLKLAEKYFRDVLQKEPLNVTASTNLAGTLLIQDRANEGWSLYEKRLNRPDNIINIPHGLQKWNGKKKISSVLLVHEQGLGDTFQFIRYAKNLIEMNIRCFFYGPKKLHKILIDSGLIENCFSIGECLPRELKYWCAVMTLPYLFNASLTDTNSTSSAYLKINEDKLMKWRKNLLVNNKFRVGLHWQGNPAHEMSISKGRSFKLDILKQLLTLDNVEYISLQKGPGSDQQQTSSFKNSWHAYQETIDKTWDFDDTLAIIQCCDLIISSDSGLAHLAGAIEKPVWLVLPWLPEWRWGLKSSKSIWYRNHILYRQSEKDDWSDCAHQIFFSLKEKFS